MTSPRVETSHDVCTRRNITCLLHASLPSMVASANYEQYSSFRGSVIPPELEGFQLGEEESELHSLVFDQPVTAFLPTERELISRSPSLYS